MSDSLQPHGLKPSRLLHPWGFPVKNTGVSCHFFLQGNLPTQGLNWCLLHWQMNSLPLSHQGSPEVKSHQNSNPPLTLSHDWTLFLRTLHPATPYPQQKHSVSFWPGSYLAMLQRWDAKAFSKQSPHQWNNSAGQVSQNGWNKLRWNN